MIYSIYQSIALYIILLITTVVYRSFYVSNSKDTKRINKSIVRMDIILVLAYLVVSHALFDKFLGYTSTDGIFILGISAFWILSDIFHKGSLSYVYRAFLIGKLIKHHSIWKKILLTTIGILMLILG